MGEAWWHTATPIPFFASIHSSKFVPWQRRSLHRAPRFILPSAAQGERAAADRSRALLPRSRCPGSPSQAAFSLN